MVRISRRAFTSFGLLLAAGCSGGSDADSPGPAPSDGSPPPLPDGGSLDAGNDVPISPFGQPLSPLTIHPSQSGVFPYTAAIYPLEGAVPQGLTVSSDDDPSLEGSILSRWPDGSASVVVLAGDTSFTGTTPKTLRLRSGASGAGAALSATRVGQLVTNVVVDCGALGAATITSFSTPERVWWANARVVCCRYRAAVGSDPSLQIVVDIHAFSSNRALVEVVLENGAIDVSLASPPKPDTKTYAATVTVNGVLVSNVSSPSDGQVYPSGRGSGTYDGGHEAFRAWAVSTWVGGDPGIEVTHDAASLQAHPMFFRCWKPAPNDFAAEYGNDLYTPWSAGHLNVPGMPGTGDIEGIGPFAQWDTRYLQSGSRFARRAVISSALGALSCNVSVRDRTSGRVPTHAQSAGHSQDESTWPATRTEPAWELAHHPAVGLMAFLCRPSPVFIELAQKIAIWNATALTADGVFGFWAQVRGLAWGIRSLAHAIFVTPDEDPWKAHAKASLHANTLRVDAFRKSPENVLGFVWFASPSTCADFEGENPGMQQPLWMHHFLITSLHAAERSKLLTGSEQSLLTEVTDWAALQPVRYVNEATAGEWRLQNYLTTVGRKAVDGTTGDNLGSGVYGAPTFDALPTYPDNLAWYYLDAPPPSTGKFIFIETNPGSNPQYRYWASAGESSSAGVGYNAIFWAALVVATERGVPGADAAWTKVTTGITNLDEWSASFAEEPRYNRAPRNK